MGRGAFAPSEASGAPRQGRRFGAVLGALCLLPVLVLLARPGVPSAQPRGWGTSSLPQHHWLLLKGNVAASDPAGVPVTPVPGPPPLQAPRRRRYTLTPARLRWDHFNLTYRILSFPRNLLSPSETRRGLAAAFRMWSDVSPFSFREVAPELPSDFRIGFYPVNHTDCLTSALHHCFDGPTGELAHAFFPPHGGIHFDDSEYWVLGPTRYSWKKGDARCPLRSPLPDATPPWHRAPAGLQLEGRWGGGDLGSNWLGGEAAGGRVTGLRFQLPEPPPQPAAAEGAELHSWPESPPVPGRCYLLKPRLLHAAQPAGWRRRAGVFAALTPGPAGVWLTDLVHVAAHEIGHALGLMHSQHVRALMHLNATLRGWKALSQDEMWGLHRLYGCLDRLFVCASWARKGFCDARRRLMKRLCPSSCDFCYEFPFPTVAATPPPPRTKTRLVPEGRNVTFRCGQKILHKKGKVYWYKDQEPLEFSYPGYLALGEAHLSIIANAINEGTYTCEVRRRQRVLTTYSWRIRVRS
ncbi:LOW QUALITY PROTEIN: matrix metalloproteinase-23 [Trichechus inunguis]